VAPSERAVVDVLQQILRPTPESLESDERAEASTRMRGLLESENLVGIGIAARRRRGTANDSLALTFYVERKISLRRLAGNEVVPPVVPTALSGSRAIPTDVIEIGRITPDTVDDLIQPGHSIGHIKVLAGTLGALVVDRHDGGTLLLSNSHVLADSGRGKVGDRILYPGQADGGKAPHDVVGHLARFAPFSPGGEFVNDTDCAVATPTREAVERLTSRIDKLGLVTGVTRARRGMEIVKVGRTTGLTTGTVNDVHFHFVLPYPGVGDVGFREQVLCTHYSQGGDSGSLVLDNASKKAVGLHFSSSPSGGSVFMPIQKVLEALDVDLVLREVGSRRAPSRLQGKTKPASISVAERARKRHAERLRGLGAHAVGVEPREGDPDRGFQVVAYFDHSPRGRLPKNIEVARGAGEHAKVPLVVRQQARFQLD
jgi:hypothetical protein